MRIFISIIFLLAAKASFSQLLSWESEDLENKFYYPCKKEISTNKVRFMVDSNVYSLPYGFTISAFDKKGRLTGLFKHAIDSFSNPYQYLEQGDTLLCIRRRNRDSTIYFLERFIYDKSGKIIQFERFVDNFTSNGKINISRTVFFYEKNELLDKLSYAANKKDKITPGITIPTDSLRLWSVKHYTYIKTKVRDLMIVKENMGDAEFRTTDTFEYDKQNRLRLHTSFAQSAYLFCSFIANHRRI